MKLKEKSQDLIIDLLNYINNFNVHFGYTPTQEQMASAFETSQTKIARHINLCKKLGLIKQFKQSGKRQCRTISLTVRGTICLNTESLESVLDES